MTAASIELQKACFAVLAADDAIAAVLKPVSVGGKLVPAIFDKVPSDVATLFQTGAGPTYITVGEGTERYELYGEAEDDGDDVELTAHMLTFHVWSQTIGMLEAKALALLMRTALRNAYATRQLALQTNTI